MPSNSKSQSSKPSSSSSSSSPHGAGVGVQYHRILNHQNTNDDDDEDNQQHYHDNVNDYDYHPQSKSTLSPRSGSTRTGGSGRKIIEMTATKHKNDSNKKTQHQHHQMPMIMLNRSDSYKSKLSDREAFEIENGNANEAQGSDQEDDEYNHETDDEDEDDEDDNIRPPPRTLTRTEVGQITVNIIISFVGAGLLGIPRAFSKAGWFLGSVALCLVSALNVYAMLLLPKVRRYVVAQQLQEYQFKLQQQQNQKQLQPTKLANGNGNGNHNHHNTLTKNDDNHNNDDDGDDDNKNKTKTTTTTEIIEPPVKIQSYGALGRVLLQSRAGELLVNFCLIFSQTGFATAYIIFIAASVASRGVVSRGTVCFGCIPGLALLVQARDMKRLAPFSFLANCANVLGLTAVLVQDVETLEKDMHEQQQQQQQQQLDNHNDNLWTTNTMDGNNADTDTAWHAIQWSGALTVMAVTLYSMEGVGLVLSLEQSCRVKRQFPALLAKVVGGITLFMAFFGTAGYAAFGDATLAPITLNLGASRAASLVQGALCVALYFTYPIMMFPVWTIAEEHLLAARSSGTTTTTTTSSDTPTSSTQSPMPITPISSTQRCLLRTSIVATTAIVAYAVPDFGEYLSLVGSSLCTILGFLLPAYFHLKTHGNVLHPVEYGLNIFLLVGGTLFAVIGTYQSLQSMLAVDDEVTTATTSNIADDGGGNSTDIIQDGGGRW